MSMKPLVDSEILSTRPVMCKHCGYPYLIKHADDAYSDGSDEPNTTNCLESFDYYECEQCGDTTDMNDKPFLLNIEQARVIGHSLGIYLEEICRIKNSSRKQTLPETFHRNYYNSWPALAGYDKLTELVEMGAMRVFNDRYLEVTENGIEWFRLWFNYFINI